MSRSRQRRPLIGGNWKMNLLSRDAEALCQELVVGLPSAPGVDLVLFPSFPVIPVVAAAVASSPVQVGGQDLHPADHGAHTGDVSGSQLADAGCDWVLCGHSERRSDHQESDELVGDKAAAAGQYGLRPMICVGESAEERTGGSTFSVLERQLTAALRHAPTAYALAYEPVWAIGTGETATPAMAQETHAFLRRLLADLAGAEAASVTRILYGGSANPGNAAELFAQPDIDGFLVGGASLDAGKLLAMLAAIADG